MIVEGIKTSPIPQRTGEDLHEDKDYIAWRNQPEHINSDVNNCIVRGEDMVQRPAEDHEEYN